MSFTVGMSVDVNAAEQTALQAYLDNADYDVPPSTSKAEAFVVACRQLLALRANSWSVAGRSLSRDSIQHELDTARTWYRANVRRFSPFVQSKFLDPGIRPHSAEEACV